MQRFVVCLIVAGILVGGCGAERAADQTKSNGKTTAGAASRGNASPKEIVLTDQTSAYECPKCQMRYDAAGMCEMGCGELVPVTVSYTCPADQKPVERAGQCPRCAMNATVTTAVVASAPRPAAGSTP
jgi:hypothetical protein